MLSLSAWHLPRSLQCSWTLIDNKRRREDVTGCMCELLKKLKLHSTTWWHVLSSKQRGNMAESPCLSEKEQPEAH